MFDRTGGEPRLRTRIGTTYIFHQKKRQRYCLPRTMPNKRFGSYSKKKNHYKLINSLKIM